MSKLDILNERIAKLKAKAREERKPKSRQQAKTRQQKFLQKMSETGKRRVGFFLSDAAMDAIKKRKTETVAPSLNHALESLLTTTPPSATLPEVTTKTVTVCEPTAEQKAIIEQARIVADAFRCWEQSPGNEQGKTLGSEAKKLADLI